MTVDRFPVEPAHVLMFARAIGDSNPAYAPAEDGEPVSTPPTFVAAAAQFDPDYHLRPQPGRPWFGSGRNATGDPGRRPSGALHAEQHYEYHRPLRSGVVLRAERRDGERWERRGKAGTVLRFTEAITEFRDAGSGELYVTARQVGVIVSRPEEGA